MCCYNTPQAIRGEPAAVCDARVSPPGGVHPGDAGRSPHQDLSRPHHLHHRRRGQGQWLQRYDELEIV